MCNTIAREVALSSSGSELIRSGLESPQRQKPPSTRHNDQRKIKHLSRSGQQLIKSINSNLNAMPSVNPILAAAKNMASPDTYCEPCAFPVLACLPCLVANAPALVTHGLWAPSRPSKYRAMGAKHEPTPRRKTANKLVRARGTSLRLLSAIPLAVLALINFAQSGSDQPTGNFGSGKYETRASPCVFGIATTYHARHHFHV